MRRGWKRGICVSQPPPTQPSLLSPEAKYSRHYYHPFSPWLPLPRRWCHYGRPKLRSQLFATQREILMRECSSSFPSPKTCPSQENNPKEGGGGGGGRRRGNTPKAKRELKGEGGFRELDKNYTMFAIFKLGKYCSFISLSC